MTSGILQHTLHIYDYSHANTEDAERQKSGTSLSPSTNTAIPMTWGQIQQTVYGRGHSESTTWIVHVGPLSLCAFVCHAQIERERERVCVCVVKALLNIRKQLFCSWAGMDRLPSSHTQN